MKTIHVKTTTNVVHTFDATSDISELIEIPENTALGKFNTFAEDIVIIGNCYVGDFNTIFKRVMINDSTIEDNVRISDMCTITKSHIKNEVILEERVQLKNCIVEENVKVCEGVSLKFDEPVTISEDIKTINITGLYIYTVTGFVFDNVPYVRLGCLTRPITDWQEDFWNNDREFREGSKQGLRRLNAFNTMVKLMESEFNITV